MKKTFIFTLAAAAVLAASCNKEDAGNNINSFDPTKVEITATSGVTTKGYIDDGTFYEKAVATMHTSDVKTARTMRMSAYYRLQDAVKGKNYFVNEIFSESGGVWKHTPALFWPIDSDLDFLAFSSSEPFTAKDAQWNSNDASKGVTLNMSRERCQDDVVFAAQQMASSEATAISGGTYTTAQPVAMEFLHSQAWLEFQLSIQQEEMKDKIAITEIIIENAHDCGNLVITRNDDVASAEWTFSGQQLKKDIVFDDSYSIYGHSKTVNEYVGANADINAKEQALEAAKLTGNTDAIAAAELALANAQKVLADSVALYPVVNPLNMVGAVNDTTQTASVGAEIRTDCVFLDMLLPQQAKTSFVIKYVLAGRPEVLEYKYDLSTGGADWEMGHKYIYDIDFVISEITVAPTVKEWQASFDGTDLSPVELI